MCVQDADQVTERIMDNMGLPANNSAAAAHGDDDNNSNDGEAASVGALPLRAQVAQNDSSSVSIVIQVLIFMPCI